MASDTTKKKHHVVLWIILTIIFILIVLPIILVYGFFYDGKVSNYESKFENFNINDVASTKLIDSMDNTSTSGNINFEITEDDINEILYTVQDSLKKSNDLLNKYMTGMRIDITDKEYVFSVSAKVPAFKTRVFLYCNLQEDHTEQAYEFKINKLKIGRAGFLTNLAFNIANKYINDTTINDALSKSNLNMKSDLANRRLVYKKKDIISDLNSLLDKNLDSIEGNYKAIAKSVISTITDNELLSFDFNSNKKISAIASLIKLHDNPAYTSDRKGIDVDNKVWVEKLTTLMNNNKFEVNQNNVNLVASYLIYGFNNVKKEAQDYVENKDFTSVGINNIKTYTGIRTTTNIDMNQKISEQFPSYDTLLKAYQDYKSNSGEQYIKIASFTEKDFTDFLINTNLFGYSSVFYYKKPDNTYKLAYMIIDNCYVDMLKGKLNLIFELNINGYKTVEIFDLSASELNQFKMVFNIEKFLVGEIEDKDGSLKNAVCEVLDECLIDANSGWISFDTNSNCLIFDMNKSITSSTLFTKYAKDAFSSKLTGDSISSKGEFELYFDIAKFEEEITNSTI